MDTYIGAGKGSPSTLYLTTDTYANIVALPAPAVGTEAYATDLKCAVKYNSLGVWAYSDSGALLPAEGSFTGKRCPYLKTSTATNDAAGYTYQTIATAEAPFGAVRVGLINGESSAVTVSKCIAGVRGSVTTAASTWYNLTFSGSDSVVLPARLGTNRPSVTYSDWVNIPSTARNDGIGTLPLFYLRTWIAAAQATFSQTTSADSLAWLNNSSPAAENGGRVWKTERQNVNAVTTPANWTSPTVVNHALPMVIEFSQQVRGITILNVGDSIRLGTPSDTAYVTNGDAFKAAIGLSSTSLPVSLVNAGWGGDNSANYMLRAIDFISYVQPDIILFAPFTPNDGTPADYRISGELGQTSQVLKAAKAIGAQVILVNGMCNTSLAWNAAADDQRKALNATLLTMGLTIIDQDSLVTDGATPARFASGASSDGLHPVAAKYTSIAALTSAAIRFVSRVP
jgi:hypothetical protein